jgi:hypothetical protein
MAFIFFFIIFIIFFIIISTPESATCFPWTNKCFLGAVDGGLLHMHHALESLSRQTMVIGKSRGGTDRLHT